MQQRDLIILVARRVVALHQQEIKYLGRKWRLWDGERWQVGSADDVFPFVVETITQLKQEKPRLAPLLDLIDNITSLKKIVAELKKDIRVNASYKESLVARDVEQYEDYLLQLAPPSSTQVNGGRSKATNPRKEN